VVFNNMGSRHNQFSNYADTHITVKSDKVSTRNICIQPQLLTLPCTNEEQALAAAYYQKYLIKYSEATSSSVGVPIARQKAAFRNVDLLSLGVEDVQTNLCKQVTQKLDLQEQLLQMGFTKKQAAISVVSTYNELYSPAQSTKLYNT
jgi:hypothetical protein